MKSCRFKVVSCSVTWEDTYSRLIIVQVSYEFSGSFTVIKFREKENIDMLLSGCSVRPDPFVNNDAECVALCTDGALSTHAPYLQALAMMLSFHEPFCCLLDRLILVLLPFDVFQRG